MKNKTRLAIFASGDGTNAENIIKYFKKHPSIEVHSLLCNNKNAGVLERIKPYNVNPKIFTKDDLYENDEMLAVGIEEIRALLPCFQLTVVKVCME